MNEISLEELKNKYQEMYRETNDFVENLENTLKGED